MTTIHAVTNDHVLAATILPQVACNNQNTVRLHVEFDDSWNGYAKSAVFHTETNPTPFEVIFSAENNCIIPPEVLARAGKLYIGVKGIGANSAEIKATTLICYKVLPGTPVVVISDPTENVYNQIMTAHGELLAAIAGCRAEIAVQRERIDSLLAMQNAES